MKIGQILFVLIFVLLVAIAIAGKIKSHKPYRTAAIYPIAAGFISAQLRCAGERT